MADRTTTNESTSATTGTNVDLARLSDADDFKVAEGFPDIRGWDVKTADGRKVGKVKDLIVSTAQLRVRYVEMEVDKSLRGDSKADEAHALLPIGSVELDDANDDVIVSGLGTDLSAYPRYTGQQITHDYEMSLRKQARASHAVDSSAAASTADSTLAGAAAGSAAAVGVGGMSGTTGSSDFYEHEHFDDQRAYAKRRASAKGNTNEQTLTLSDEQLNVAKNQVSAGEVAVRKTVETEHVSQQVPLMREEVTIERRPVTGAGASSGQIDGAEEIRIPLMREEAVVQKQAVVREEIIVRKKMVTENQTVEADLQRERLSVDGEKVREDRASR